MSRDTWRMSPQQTDPLSWFTRPMVPMVFSALMVSFGAVSIGLTWEDLAQPWLEIVALSLAIAACLAVVVSTKPMRRDRSVDTSLVPMILVLSAVALSSVNTRESTVLAQHWWVPVGVGFVIGTLGPFSSVVRTVVNGLFLSAAVAIGAFFSFPQPALVWPPLSIVVIPFGWVIQATVATAVMSWVLVSSTQSFLLSRSARTTTDESTSREAARRVELRTLARLGTRVAPFLEGIAAAGVVTAPDRVLAGQLARRLRTDLIGRANRSWLESVALAGPMYVVDPDHRADQMNTVQRTVLRGLLLEIMGDPDTRNGSLFVELRKQPDNSTAVALTIDIDLPEGRRTAMIAPYYITLKSAVNDLQWDATRELLKFNMPAPGVTGDGHGENVQAR